jgi:signal transduction histidine kinase
VLNPATGRFQSYIASPSEKNGPSTNTILSLYEDRDNILWIGTYGGGLDRFDRATSRWEHFTEAEGLPNNVIYGILPDDGGNLWLTTNKGLARFHPATAAVKTYDVHDGLQGNEFNQGSYHRSRRGEMFIGGINGLNAFFPDSVRDNPYPPPVYLTSFRVFDKPIALATPLPETREIVLPHDRNFFSVEFVALSYTSPQRNQYMYILEGLDEAWRDAGTRRYTTYTNLDPGSYTLRIRGSNNDGLWNMEGTMVSITIVPPYWKTWWFRILAVLGAGALLFLMYRYRVQKLLEIERIRTAIATDLHDDIGSSLTEIALFSDLGLRELRARPTPAEDGKLGSILADIGTTSRNLIDAMNDIVWSVDPKNDSFDFLLVRMKMHASKMLDARGINYEIDIPEELSSLKLPLGYRRRLFLIYKEAINNILKHARPTTVSLSMRREGRTLMMTIVDDGIGFDPSSPAAGNGLHNMQERARTLGGEITIASARTRGTAIALHAPIP